MEKVHYTKDIIRDILHRYSSDNLFRHVVTGEFAIFVNKSIFQKVLNVLGIKYQPRNWDYQLQIGTRVFEMKVAYFPDNMYDSVINLVNESQFSMPWLDRLTFFSNLSSYNDLEKFIDHHKLRSQIVSTIVEEGPSGDGSAIRVVTFSDRVDKKDLITKYLKKFELDKLRPYFFVTLAFPWLQPHKDIIKEAKIGCNNHNHLLFKVLPHILNHLSSINYSNELNIFDLISLKLATTNDRSLAANRLRNEIDYFITRILRQMNEDKTYLKDKQFNLRQYVYDRNCIPEDEIIHCFLYEFQNYVESVLIDYYKHVSAFVLSFGSAIIKLVDQSDVLQLLDSKTNKLFIIDGKNFDRMTLRLFTDLWVKKNVIRIILDTNYRWISEVPPLITNEFEDFRVINIKFIGDNVYEFIEGFVLSLKTLSYPKDVVNLTTNQRLSCFTVFDNFVCGYLRIGGIFINTRILNDLIQCNLSHITCIVFNDCTLENKVENWELLNNIKYTMRVMLLEDEWTWQYLFEFIAKHLIRSKLQEFSFTSGVKVYITSNTSNVLLNNFVFRFDEFVTKLEIFYKNEKIDLYDYKNNVTKYDDLTDFEFYK